MQRYYIKWQMKFGRDVLAHLNVFFCRAVTFVSVKPYAYIEQMQIGETLLKEPANSYSTVNATGNEYGYLHGLYFFKLFFLILVLTAYQK